MFMKKVDAYRTELENQKSASTLQLLFKAARLLNEVALRRTRERTGVPELRTAYTSLLPHIDLEGTRLVELARRAGISKQAVGQLVDELEALGTCERVPDRSDGRAKLVRFSKRGRRQLLEGLALLRKLESELAAQIGRRRVEELRRTLTLILDSDLVGELTATPPGDAS
jgi:DNA-binding MarR family transcriptional regulator